MTMQVQSGFRENAEHFFDNLGADYSPAPVISKSQDDWGSEGSLPVVQQAGSRAHVPAPVQDDRPTPFDPTSYAFLDKMHRDNITDIEQAIGSIQEEMIPGVHPKLVESYAQLLERRTSAINAYTEFLKTQRKTDIEERKMAIAEKKAGMGKFADSGKGGGNGLTMSPQQLAEFVRAIDTSRFNEIPEAEEESNGRPDRSFDE